MANNTKDCCLPKFSTNKVFTKVFLSVSPWQQSDDLFEYGPKTLKEIYKIVLKIHVIFIFIYSINHFICTPENEFDVTLRPKNWKYLKFKI